VLVTGWPPTQTKEHMDEALVWGHKSVVGCRPPVEVQQMPFKPDPKGATE